VRNSVHIPATVTVVLENLREPFEKLVDAIVDVELAKRLA
jgi:hypothetical protein